MKKLILLTCVAALTLLLVSCATFNDEGDADTGTGDEVSQETQNLEKTADAENSSDESLDNPDQANQEPVEDQSEDQNASQDIDQSGDQQVDEQSAENQPVAEDQQSQDDLSLDDSNQQPDQTVENAAPQDTTTFADEENIGQDLNTQNEAEQAPAPEATGGPVTITGIDYKANENGGTVVIQTDAPAQYTTEENAQTNQFVVDIQNATLPKKFSRPYNTKEFSGPIGLINAYKKPGTSDVRVIIQLKKASAVSIVQQGNSLVLVPGGSSVPKTDEPKVADNAQATTAEEDTEETNDGSAQAEENVKGSLLQSKTLDEFLTGENRFYGKKISLEIVNGELREVFNFIAEESGANMILSDDVTGKISVKLRQIPWDQALVVIMQTKQLGYIRQGNILRIAPLTAIRAETDAAKQLLEAQKQLEPIKVKILPISYSKAKDLEVQVQGFLSTRGTVKADERTNSLVVRDIAENLVKVDKLIQKLDTQTPQVYIEGKIVESSVANAKNIGVQWDAGQSSATIGYDIGSSIVQRTGVLGLTAKLQLLESDEKIKILSSPRIVTLNNQTANIEQATQFPTYTITTDPTTHLQTKQVSYQTVHLNLKVTPQITAEGGVILNTEILREFAGAPDSIAPETGARSLNSRSAKSTVLVHNGQTAVLGGIYSTDNTASNAGIPILREIPIIGWLFGHDQLTYNKNELLIFLTPRVINKDKAFQMSGDGSDTESL
jgi:type IV pilus assembly protein PilQ